MPYFCFLSLFLWISCQKPPVPSFLKDPVADRMLLYQRINGGWPQPGGNPIDYNSPISPNLESQLIQDKSKLDATFDDLATNREIRYLAKAYQNTQNPTYLDAVESGLLYIFNAQNAQGGWPQFFPDQSNYRKYITFNDRSMTNTLWTLQWVVEGTEGFDVVSPALKAQAKKAIQKGIKCILNCQIEQQGQKLVWCAQHHHETLAPAKARAFELPSLSGAESVEIIRFLMHQPSPSQKIIQSILSGCDFLEKVKLPGIKIIEQAGDRIVVPDAESTLWARFYDLQTHKPIFVGRDGIPKPTLAEIEIERRTGYAYYGIWPKTLLAKELPLWKRKHGL